MVNEQIVKNGPMSFAEYQELALYHPQSGFYSGRGSAGRGRDFVTSPEVGPLFGQVLGAALDKWWLLLGRPNPFYVFEAGAGTGTLAVQLLAAEPRCMNVMRYVMVERSASLRSEQGSRLHLSDPNDVLNPIFKLRSGGPMFASLSDLPSETFVGIVLANELLDNMPVDLYEKRGSNWYRIFVGAGKEGGFEEVFERLDPEDDAKELAYVKAVAPRATDGGRFPLQRSAINWLTRALAMLDRGKVVVIDYAQTTQWMLTHNFEDWMRTYRNQRPGTDPLDAPGTQDITCEVAIDQLERVRKPDRSRLQVDFLEDFGLGDLVADARAVWHTRSVSGDIGVLKARGKVQEGRALTDLQGLGRYRVLEWDVGFKTSDADIYERRASR